MTLGEMLGRAVKAFPKKNAIIYRELAITYEELNDLVNRLANGLIDLGFQKGDRICVMMPRIPELVISFLAVARCGGIFVPLNYEFKPGQIKKILNTLQPFGLMVQHSFLAVLQEAMSLLQSSPQHIIVAGGDAYHPYYKFREVVNTGKSTLPPRMVSENETVYLNYTSGSTGNAKGAITTHANIEWNTLAAIDTLGLTVDDVHLCMFAPYAHPHELFARPLYLGGTMVLLDNVYPKSLATSISDHKVSCLMGLAPLYEMLLDIVTHSTYDLSSLRIPESGGMFTPIDLLQRFEKRFGVSIIPVWGSTETTGIAVANSLHGEQRYGSIGKPCKYYEVKIVSEKGEELPPNEVGELLFTGPAVVSGYYNAPEETQESFTDGWYHSGDLGRKDDDGFFYFVERKSGMIKTGGLKVYPLEVENILRTHPEIKEVAVIRASERLRGEVPKAVVVLRDGARLTSREITHFCQERMARYKVPRIVEFKDELPKIGSGKINKKALELEERQ